MLTLTKGSLNCPCDAPFISQRRFVRISYVPDSSMSYRCFRCGGTLAQYLRMTDARDERLFGNFRRGSFIRNLAGVSWMVLGTFCVDCNKTKQFAATGTLRLCGAYCVTSRNRLMWCVSLLFIHIVGLNGIPSEHGFSLRLVVQHRVT